MKLLPYLPALLLLALLPVAATAQVVEGRVLEHGTDTPLEGADIVLLSPEEDRRVALTFSDSAGLFRIAAPAPGAWRIAARLIGRGEAVSEPLELAEDETVRIEIRMAVAPVAIEEPIVVVAERGSGSPELEAFWNRVERGERTGFGHFIYGEDLELTSYYASDLLRSVPGVTVRPGTYGQIVRMRGGCVPAIYLDGTQVNRHNRLDSLDQWVSMIDIEGIEVYRGPYGPARFTANRGGTCGLVLIWTKRGQADGDGKFGWKRLFVGLGLIFGIFLLR
jgi:hypothetical protein